MYIITYYMYALRQSVHAENGILYLQAPSNYRKVTWTKVT